MDALGKPTALLDPTNPMDARLSTARLAFFAEPSRNSDNCQWKIFGVQR